MKIRDFFSTFNISALGLTAQKNKLAVTAENIANATTTRTNEGTAYKRKYLVSQAINDRQHFSGFLNRARVRLSTSSSNHISRPSFSPKDALVRGDSRINNKILESDNLKQIYDPSHPDANEAGIVEYPDINVVNEMLELIASSRIYEANITVMNATKNLAKKTLDI